MTTKGRRAADRRRERQGKGPVDDDERGTMPGAVAPLPSEDDERSEPGDDDLPLVSQVREVEPDVRSGAPAATTPGRGPKGGRPGIADSEVDPEASFVRAVAESAKERRTIGEITVVKPAPEPKKGRKRGGRLVVLAGPDAGGEAVLEVTPTLVGRTATAEIGLSDPTISLRHLEIRATGKEGSGTFALVDLGSTSGTLVNGVLVDGEAPLAHGDVIALGKTELRFLRADALPQPRKEPEPPPAPAPEPTEQLPPRERSKVGPGPGGSKVGPRAGLSPSATAIAREAEALLEKRARIRRVAQRIIGACVGILVLAVAGKLVHARWFDDASPAQIRAQVAELLADGRNRLRAQDVDGARAAAETVLALDPQNDDAESLMKVAMTEADARDAIALALRLGDEERDIEAGQILKRVPDASVFAPTRDRLRRTLDERGTVRSRRAIESLLDQGRVKDAVAAMDKHLQSSPNDGDGLALAERVKAAEAAAPKGNPALNAARAAFAAGELARARALADEAGLKGYAKGVADFEAALARGRGALQRLDGDAAEAMGDAFRLLGELGASPSSPIFAEVRTPYGKALYLAGTDKLEKNPCGAARDLFRAARVIGDDAGVQRALRQLDERAVAGLDRARAARGSDPERAAAVAREHLCLARSGSRTYDELRDIARLP